MDVVLQGLAIYVILLLIVRLADRRRLSQASVSDLLLFLVIGEATQQVLGARDYSLGISAAIIVLLIALNRLVDLLSARADRGREEQSLVVVDHGEALHDRMGKARITPEDVLAQARALYGIEHMDEILYALLDKSGDIAIVPREAGASAPRAPQAPPSDV